ncbi:MAG: hypothetical protein K2Q25_02800 [Mycobacteriaceae bacterium]|nr:hypothetical protein [Mycobacteriaceae bacterium]
MSGPSSPGPESEEWDVSGQPNDPEQSDHTSDDVSATDEDLSSRAYSAPESEQFFSGPYVSADLALYDYDSYSDSSDGAAESSTPRWPWVVGVAAIVAAIALVVSVSLLVTRADTSKLATPGTLTPLMPPMQDEITTKTAPPLSPATTTENAPPPPPESPPVTSSALPAPSSTPVPAPPITSATPAPPEQTTPAPTTTAAAVVPTTSSTPAGPRQVTYTVTGTKAPGDIISVTYIDASGRRRTQHNVYIPWSMTVTPISQSDVGSVEASSLFRVSRLNCSITTSDGAVLSSNTNDAPSTSC